METIRALAILEALANGVDPMTGAIFPANSPYQSVEVVHALHHAVVTLKAVAVTIKEEVPTNAGKSWTSAEDERLIAAFNKGRSIADIARQHQRTNAGTQARLEKHGLIKK